MRNPQPLKVRHFKLKATDEEYREFRSRLVKDGVKNDQWIRDTFLRFLSDRPTIKHGGRS